MTVYEAFVNIYKKIFCNRLDEESYECILEQIEEQVEVVEAEIVDDAEEAEEAVDAEETTDVKVE